jgi:dTDP-4-amino-4,6-dideoxygalactose transaminase
MKVPLLDLKEQNSALRAELDAAYARVMQSGQFIMGPELTELETACARVVQAKHAIGVSSGTDAILLALMALGIGPGDEVICPSFTFFSTAGCIARVGAKPVFADSCEACFNIDVADAARRVTPHTKAIMPVDLYGQAADMDGVMALAAKHNLAVIEDAAQALSAEYKGRHVGTIGTFGTYSFFPSKNLGGFGDAGLLVTNDDALAEKARLLRTHGAKPKYFHKLVGANLRMDPLQAALLRVKLPHLQEYSRRRAANAAHYHEKLSALPGVAMTGSLECESRQSTNLAGVKIALPVTHGQRCHIWNQYTLRVPRTPAWTRPESPRDALKNQLAARGVGSEIYYPRPMHLQECFAVDGERAPALPTCERLAEEALSIPIYPELQPEQLNYVVGAIAEFLRD